MSGAAAGALRRPVGALARSQAIGPLLILSLVFAVASLTTDRFLNLSNLRNLGLSLAIVAIIAIGSTFVILTAQIDLSPGAVVALTSMTTAVLLHNERVGLVATLALMLLLGAGVGLVNGFFCTYGRIPSFILTLGTMSVYRGIAYLETGGTPIFSLSPVLHDLFYGTVAGVANPFILVVVLYALAWAYLRYTRGGRAIYAVGGNESAARLAGIKVNRVRTKVFVIAGVLSAFGGVLMSAQLDSGSPDYGQGMELTAIAAAVIGGTSLFGGQGNVIATLFGAMIITIVQNVLNLHAVGTAWQNITLGVIIALAVGADMWRGSVARVAVERWSHLARLRPPTATPSPEEPAETPSGEAQEHVRAGR
jgi:ribose transport system permease protein